MITYTQAMTISSQRAVARHVGLEHLKKRDKIFKGPFVGGGDVVVSKSF
jgi:hypothetical protein